MILFRLRRILTAGKRPAAVRFDHFVNLSHQADRFFERDDYALVMRDVFLGESAPATVFQPLLADLITAYMKIPYLFGNIFTGARRIDKGAALLILGITLCDFCRPAAREASDGDVGVDFVFS